MLDTLKTVIDYYVNLLIIQYHNKPKAQATIALLIKLAFANMILLQIRDGFDYTKAKGEPLDIIGEWVGLTRFYDGKYIFYRPWFALIDWDSTPDNLQGGFSEFSDFETLEGGILDYNDFQPSQNKLDDTSFGLLIGLKIIANSIKYTAKNIDTAIYNYFGGDVYTTWSETTLTYHYPAELREFMQVAEYKKVLPAPTGVTIDLQEL